MPTRRVVSGKQDGGRSQTNIAMWARRGTKKRTGKPDPITHFDEFADMEKQEYKQLMEILVGASTRNGAELESYLDEQCGDDQTLRDRIKWMVEEERQKAQATVIGGDALTEGLSDSAGAEASMAGKQIGNYELLEELGRGGMGVVYKAKQIRLNRIVALKMILAGQLASDEEISRFRTEAESAAKLDHPGIVPIFEVDECDGHQFFSMGLVRGESLAQHTVNNPLDGKAAAQIVRQIALAVEYAHRQGVVHRDLKPPNILIDEEGKPRVTDFGLAKQLRDSRELTGTGQVLGTPGYMAPEQAKGDLDAIGPTSDVYGLGAILYFLLVGRPPFQASNAFDTLVQSLEREPVRPRALNPDIDRDLETICLKCLEKSPQRRYQSAAEVAEELTRAIAGLPIHARPVSPSELAWRWCGRHQIITSLSLTVVALTMIGVVTVLSQWMRAENNRRAAEVNAEAAEKQRQVAEAATRDAKAQETLAIEQSEIAEEQSRLTLDTLSLIVYEINDRLLEVPEAHSVRRQLIETTLGGLENVSNSLKSNPKRNRGLIQTHFALGDLMISISAHTERDPVAMAKVQYERAKEVAAVEFEKYPEDSRVIGDYMIAYEKLGDIALRQKEYDKGVLLFQRALDLAEELLEISPDNKRTLWGVFSDNYFMGYARYKEFRFDEAIEYFETAQNHLETENARGIDIAKEGNEVLPQYLDKLLRVSRGAPKALEDEQFALAQGDLVVDLMLMRANHSIVNNQLEKAAGILERTENLNLAALPDQFNLACSYGRYLELLEQAAADVDAADIDSAERDRASMKAVDAIRKVEESGFFSKPVLHGMIRTDSDLIAVWNTPTGKQYLEDLVKGWADEPDE